VQKEMTALMQSGATGRDGGGRQLSAVRVGRFIRDDSTNETLILATSNEGYGWARQITLVYVKYPSSTIRYRLQATCEKSAFLAGRFEESVLVSAHDIQLYTCSVCGSPSSSACGCVLSQTVPRSPLDFSAFSRNCLSKFRMGSHEKIVKTYGRSSIYGSSVVHALRLHVPEQEIRRAISSHFVAGEKRTNDSYMAGVNVPAASVLQGLGIQSSLGKAKISRFAMPSTPPRAEAVPPAEVCPDYDNTSQTASLIVQDLFRHVLPCTEDSEDARACERSDQGHGPAAGLEDLLASGQNNALTVGTIRNHADRDGFDVQFENVELDVSSGREPTCNSLTRSGTGPNYATSSAEDTIGLAVYNRGGRASSPDGGVTKRGRVVDRKKPVPILAQDEIERRAIRQTRNREAAARSNARRKAHLQTLKMDLEDAHKRVQTLLGKEAELRAGNVALKDQAVKVWRSEMKVVVPL
jgi:hypothetical protein